MACDDLTVNQAGDDTRVRLFSSFYAQNLKKETGSEVPNSLSCQQEYKHVSWEDISTCHEVQEVNFTSRASISLRIFFFGKLVLM